MQAADIAEWKLIEAFQRHGVNRVTAWGAYKKAGGTMSARRFRALWRLARLNPFRFRGLA